MEKVEVNIAPMSKRVSAYIVDDILISLIIFTLFYEQLALVGAQMQESLNTQSLVGFQEGLNSFFVANLMPIVGLKVAYHTFFIWQGGKTIGKHIAKIKVVDLESSVHPDLLKAFLRAVVRIVSESFMYIGFIVAFFLPLKQTMHDKLTNCVVIND